MKWKKSKDRLGKDVLESDGSMIMLPITYQGEATKTNYDNQIQVRGYRQKHSDLILTFTRWTKFGKKEIRNSDALEGKKIKVTIEVLED
jgi:hypothetical protein